MKYAVLSSQEPPPGMCPYVCVAGVPQTINASNNFGTDVIEACKEAAKQVGNLTVSNSSKKTGSNYNEVELKKGGDWGPKQVFCVKNYSDILNVDNKLIEM